MKDNENQSIAPALPGIARCLHHHKELIVQRGLAGMCYNQFVVTGSVAGLLKRDEESQSAPESEKDEDQRDEDEFLVQMDHGRCELPLYIDTSVGASCYLHRLVLYASIYNKGGFIRGI